MARAQELIDRLWADYSALNPQARAIRELLSARGEVIVNDHIALRTFGQPEVSVDAVAASFTGVGYRPRDEYIFREKKLFARYYQHDDPSLPKVFISELKVGEFTAGFGAIVRRLVGQVAASATKAWEFPASGRPWQVSWGDYEALLGESEYGAWVAAFGFRANHFTVLVNGLRTFGGLADLNEFLKQRGFALNAAGGEIKGSPQVYLEQSSTLADKATVPFADGAHVIPACYYEFARRYPLVDGTLFQGFVEKSADRIFESTNKR